MVVIQCKPDYTKQTDLILQTKSKTKENSLNKNMNNYPQYFENKHNISTTTQFQFVTLKSARFSFIQPSKS